MANLFLNQAKKCLILSQISLASIGNFLHSQNILLAAPISFDNSASLSPQEGELRLKGCYHEKLHQKQQLNQNNLPGYRTEPHYRCGGTYFSPTFTALIPEDLLAKTLKDLPTFFWYIPYRSTKEAEFTLVKNFDLKNLVDSNCPQCFNVDMIGLTTFQKLGEVVYHTTIPLTGVPGVIRFTLPSTQNLPSLEVDQAYFWQLKLIPAEYNTFLEPDLPLPVVTGWIQRINPDSVLTSQLNQASLQQRTTIYAKMGLWNDVLTNLSELTCSNNSPKLENEWKPALKALNLENLTGKSLVNCSDSVDSGK